MTGKYGIKKKNEGGRMVVDFAKKTILLKDCKTVAILKAYFMKIEF